MILTHPGLTKLTFMDYLLTMLRNLLRRKLGYDSVSNASADTRAHTARLDLGVVLVGPDVCEAPIMTAV